MVVVLSLSSGNSSSDEVVVRISILQGRLTMAWFVVIRQHSDAPGGDEGDVDAVVDDAC